MTESEGEGAAGTIGEPAAAAFAALLRLYRHRALLTQEDLANRSGVSVRAIRNLESGRSRPRYSSVRLLTRALGLTDQEHECLTAVIGGLDSVGFRRDSMPAPAIPAQLPPEPAFFVGRSGELARLDAILCRGPAAALANVSGAAGIGKTALALHWAHRSARHFPDGVLYAALQGFGSPDSQPAEPTLVLARFIRGLGGDAQAIPDDLEERSDLYRSLLHHRRVLVLLDDATSERQVRPLLPAAPGCRVLVTSRIRLAALDGVQLVDLEVLEPGPTLELFSKVAGPQRVAAEAARVHLGEVCTRTGDWKAARQHLAAARSLSLLAADRFGEAFALRLLGELARQEESLAATMSQLAGALSLFHEDGIELWQARTIQGMDAAASATGDREAAQALWENDYELFAELGVPDMDPI